MAEYLDNMSISEQDQGSQSNTTSQRNSTRPTQIVSVRKRSLNHLGYKDLKHWLTNPQNIYIGWDMTHYVPGAVGSKWEITYKERDYPNIETRLEMYRKYIETDRTKYDGKTLFESLEELRGKTLGCWCKPDPCHGDIIIQLLKSKNTTGSSYEPSGRYSNKQIQRKHESIGQSRPSQKGRRIQSARPPVTRIVNVKKRSLNEKGYKDLEHWLTNQDNIYIGRDMTHYVPGAVGSKWQNPFKEQDYPKLDTRLDMYKKHIETTKYDGKLLV